MNLWDRMPGKKQKQSAAALGGGEETENRTAERPSTVDPRLRRVADLMSLGKYLISFFSTDITKSSVNMASINIQLSNRVRTTFPLV